MQSIIQMPMLNDINNFIKWLLLKVFILNEVNIVTKLQGFLFSV